MTESTTQFELFEGLPQDAPRPRPVFHIGTLSVRYDHVVLVALMGLVASSVVFAVGVERGKRLARVERPLLAAPAGPAAKATNAASPSKSTSATASETAESGEAKAAPAQKALPTPSKPRKTPIKVADRGAKFAIQVSAYRQGIRAQEELQRLQQGGERAFLLKKSDRIVVLVGPFPSKAHASSKLANLKTRYQDCFVKSL